MPLGKHQRKLLRGLGLFVAAGFLLLVLLPLWFPWVLTPWVRSKGLHYRQYERKGLERFVLHDVSFTNQTFGLHADRLDALIPTTWLWRCLAKSGATTDPFLRVNNYQVELHFPSNSPPSSTYTNIQDALGFAQTIQRWLPAAVLSNGTIRVEHTALEAGSAVWSKGKLITTVEMPQRAWNGVVAADVSRSRVIFLKIDSDSQELHSAIRITTVAQTLTLQSSNLWHGSAIGAEAEFGTTGLLPRTARLHARDFDLPATFLGVEGYEDLKGAISAEWAHEHFTAEIDAEARPRPGKSHLPPLALHISAIGDGNSTTLKSAKLSAPWLSAELSRDATLHFSGPLLRQSTTLQFTADLSQQTWVPLTGELTGEIDFVPLQQTLPKARFHISGSSVGFSSIKAAFVSLEGGFGWPRLEIGKADMHFADGSSLTGRTTMDLQKGIVAGGHVEFSGPLARQWLPSRYSYQALVLSADFRGPLGSLSHQGHLEAADVTGPEFRPIQLCLDWTGLSTNIDHAEILASAGKMVFSAEGALDLGAPGAECLLRNLLLTTNGTPLLELEKPARVVFRRQTEPLKRLVLNLEGIHLFGPGGEIETRAAIDWPDYGDVYVSIQKLNSGFVTNFVKNSGPEIEIRNLHTSANWSNGPAKVEIELSGAAAHFSCDLKLTGDEHGIIISNLMVSSATSLVATAYGFLPATFQPNARSNQLHFIPKVPLRLAATTQPDSLLWEALGNWTGLVLREPELNLNVSGTWSDPVGIIHLAARRIQFRRESKETPNLENLRLNVQLDKQQARIVECQLLVDRQPVNLTAQLPLGDQFWSRPDPRKFADWDKASARLRIENANLASFTHLVPDVLAPAGHLNLDMSLQPGAKLEGSLEIGSVRTRPLPNLGTIRDIQLKLKILQKDVVLESASAEVGGAIVHANGQADFRQFNWPDPQVPPFKFTLRGTNVPLSREPEVIVRSDLDLAVIKTNHDPAIVSGTVRLKNSIYLRDLADLVPGKVSEPEHRPPYFSIPTEPFAHWRVAVQVIGDKFLTVRTPLFNGRVSSNLRILGTLREPIALGDLKIDSGNVKFPFASLQVLQGLITLSSGDPYHPQLTISAGSRKFGYDVRMELSGPADSPLIQFSSTPPLSSEQLVLMLTAGELPKNELTLTPQQKAQTVGLFFGRDFLSKLGIGDEGEERLTIRSGEEISEHGTPTYTLEYKLSDRWTLVGEYDRFNDFNAGFKWRVYSK